MAIILFMGAVSGAHLNPAVSIAFAARGDFPWRRVPGYIIVQLIGATLACLVLWAILGKIGDLGATEPGPGVDDWQAMLFEFILTLGLVSTILGTASGAQNIGVFGALAVGGYIILAGFWSSPISGASMNPCALVRARSGERRLLALLGLHRRAARRRAPRRGVRLRPSRCRRREERECGGPGAGRHASHDSRPEVGAEASIVRGGGGRRRCLLLPDCLAHQAPHLVARPPSADARDHDADDRDEEEASEESLEHGERATEIRRRGQVAVPHRRRVM